MAFNLVNPTFPPEIEHIIFTAAVEHQDLSSFPINLILVAKRVYQWLTPIIYRTISLHENHEYPNQWNPEKLAKYGNYVRNLFVWVPSSRFNKASPHLPLSLCPNVTNLLWWSPANEAEIIAMSQLPLTRLSIDLNDIERALNTTKEFYRVTHLDSLGLFTEDLSILDRFTCLTHLSILGDGGFASISPIFERVPKLQVLIYYNCKQGVTKAVVQDFRPESDDPRLVRMTCGVGGGFEDWFEDIIGGRGIWGLAEEAIEGRKKGEQDGSRT
ncbi:hypothetical protein BDN72DRAFT_962833 [Pluteus cervinus]|uniref:Uncharacterized protein n=1 Tax=Pluteus cervinus TaxID=181527 RepID=A0ACD3AHH6_9AGAR|nr:hypothetical protein BDN72DRAFT_962833 [Pluteus cervinus]